MSKYQISRYSIKNSCINESIHIAFLSDLHDKPYKWLIEKLKKEKLDYILIAGDILYGSGNGYILYDDMPNSGQHFKYSLDAKNFLSEARAIAPVYISIGNHEIYLNASDYEILNELGITLLDDDYIRINPLVIGGLSSPYRILAGTRVRKDKKERELRIKLIEDNLKTEWLTDFEDESGFKILLSHHPEFYERHLKNRENINLILSGHAHGGQIRLFGHGLYAHIQGFFPRYTQGIIDNKMIISRGLSNTSVIPRLFNPYEIVLITIEK